ncbi:MAG: DUF2510 domain-containing protein [Candidatus Nanopelagicales bacterium]
MSQEWALTPGYEQPKRKGKGAIITGAVLMGLGLVLGIVGIAGITATGASAIAAFAAPVTAPGASLNQLDARKDYVVYQLLDATADRISAADVTVEAPDGSTVRLNDVVDVTDSYTSGSDTFVSVASFNAPVTGQYTTSVGVPGAVFVVGPGLSAIGQVVVWGLLIGLATILGIIGLVVLIVGLVRRSNSKPKPVAYGSPVGAVGAGYGTPAQPYVAPAQTPQPQIFEQAPGEQQPFATPAPAAPAAPTPPPAAAALPPAGWYPDPGRPGGQRYWDGQQWTEHQA